MSVLAAVFFSVMKSFVFTLLSFDNAILFINVVNDVATAAK